MGSGSGGYFLRSPLATPFSIQRTKSFNIKTKMNEEKLKTKVRMEMIEAFPYDRFHHDVASWFSSEEEVKEAYKIHIGKKVKHRVWSILREEKYGEGCNNPKAPNYNPLTDRQFANPFEVPSLKDLEKKLKRRRNPGTLKMLYLMVKRFEIFDLVDPDSGRLNEFYLSSSDKFFRDAGIGWSEAAQWVNKAQDFGLIECTCKEFLHDGINSHPKAYIFNPYMAELIKEHYMTTKLSKIEAIRSHPNKGC